MAFYKEEPLRCYLVCKMYIVMKLLICRQTSLLPVLLWRK